MSTMTKYELEKFVSEKIEKSFLDRGLQDIYDDAHTPAAKNKLWGSYLESKGSGFQGRAKSFKQIFDIDKDKDLDDCGFDNLEDFLKALNQRGLANDVRLKDLVTGTPDAGGYLVPEQFAAQMLDNALEDEIVRPRATVYGIRQGDSITVPGFKIGDHSTDGINGVIAQWTEEAKSKTKTDPNFRKIYLKVKKLVAFTKSSDELFQDSGIPLSSVIGKAFSAAIGFYQDIAYLRGSGVGQPQGILNSACILSQSGESGQTASTIIFENCVGMLGKLAPASFKKSIWIASISTVPQLLNMQRPVGTGGSFIPVLQESGGNFTLLTRPVLFTEKVPILGSAGCLMLADFSQYAIAIKNDFRLESSIHADFRSDLTQWRAVLRVDGQPIPSEAVTLYDGTTEVSPFVQLAAIT